MIYTSFNGENFCSIGKQGETSVEETRYHDVFRLCMRCQYVSTYGSLQSVGQQIESTVCIVDRGDVTLICKKMSEKYYFQFFLSKSLCPIVPLHSVYRQVKIKPEEIQSSGV
jgi:hypothetical protein